MSASTSQAHMARPYPLASDGPAVRPHGYRGTVEATEEMKAELAELARRFPIGSRIRHTSGREGTVTLDQPPHVPGAFDGKPTAWCLESEHSNEALVCAAWDNERGFDRWLVWVPLRKIQHADRRRTNRPAAKGGAR